MSQPPFYFYVNKKPSVMKQQFKEQLDRFTTAFIWWQANYPEKAAKLIGFINGAFYMLIFCCIVNIIF